MQKIDKREIKLKAKLSRERNNFRNFSNTYFKIGRPHQIDQVTQAIINKNSTGSIQILQYEPYLKENKKGEDSQTKTLREVPSRQVQSRASGYSTHFMDEEKIRSQTACSKSSSRRKAFQKNFEDIPNVEFSSNTWDCQHLDGFVKSHNHDQEVFSQSRIPSASQKQMASLTNSILDQKNQKACQFSTMARFPKTTHLNFKNDFPSNYSTSNFLVTQQHPQKEAIKYFSTNFIPQEKNFDETKLQFYKQPATLAKPSKKLEELKLAKTSQEKFQQWKSEFHQQSKKYKIHKWEFPSGILGIDNPMNQYTQLYKNEFEQLSQKEKINKQYQIHRAQQLKQLQKTHQEIEFFNKQPSHNNSKTHQNIKIIPSWKNKQHPKEKFMEKFTQTHERLFGQAEAEKKNLKRTLNMVENETKGKNFNIISSVSFNLQ